MKILAVIPVRGKSKGIPRKNIRIINGKPLVSYCIENVKAIQNEMDLDIVVDTEDTEIAEIVEQLGTEISNRPENLSGDDVTLDPVIYHALIDMEKKKRCTYDIVMTLQATSPTLKSESIKAALQQFIDGDYDTMISAVNDAHLSWEEKDGRFVPKYLKRLNRQQLPKEMRETGGFLITKRNCVSNSTRIGEKITLYELPKDEAIDIDDVYDWKVCETILSSKRIILRADGNEELGMGHIYRCLSIAYHLTDHKILFVIKKISDLGIKKLEESFFDYIVIDENEELLPIIEEYKPDIVVNDILDTSYTYMEALKNKVQRVVNFEDRGEGAKVADSVINSLYAGPREVNEYNGFKYFFIRDEFITATPKIFSDEVRNIVVLFGGTDPSDMTRKIYKILKEITKKFPQIEVHIITGFGYRFKDQVLTDKESNIFVHNDVKLVSKYLAKADLAITGQGRTMYELACMGVPAIVFAQNPREMTHVFANISNGFLSLGIGKEQENEAIQSTLEWIIQTPFVRKQMHQILTEKDFRRGQERVLRLILGDNNGDD